MEIITDRRIKEFLENAPLYSWVEFTKPMLNRRSLWIEEIDAYCTICKQMRPFQDFRPRGGGSGSTIKAIATGTSYLSFSCVSCRKESHEYLIEQIVSESTIKLQKYGELPRKNLERDPLLQKFFSHDSENYEKAIVCLAHGYGIAAFAYLRRIVERNIGKLLDMIQEDSSEFDEVLEALSNLRIESPMSQKIKIANNALPEHLKPDGLNPLGKLYQILSEGIHSLDDKECLERANAIKECLKYLISELASRKNNQSRFKNLVGSI